jgi:hypothetical protein
MLPALVASSGFAAPAARRSGILAPHQVPLETAVAEGRQAAAAPQEGAFWRWRRDLLSRHPDGPLARVLVVTPYVLVMRESYRRAMEGHRMRGSDGREVLRRAVRESGAAFPLTLVLIPVPGRGLPAPEALTLVDGSDRVVRRRGAARRESGVLLHLTYDLTGVDPRRLSLRVAGRPGYLYPIDVRGMD